MALHLAGSSVHVDRVALLRAVGRVVSPFGIQLNRAHVVLGIAKFRGCRNYAGALARVAEWPADQITGWGLAEIDKQGAPPLADWSFTMDLHSETLFVGFSEERYSPSRETFVRLAAQLHPLFPFVYGYVYTQDASRAPSSYALGINWIGPGLDRPTPREEEEIRRWAGVLYSSDLSSVLRDLYEVNFLSKEHLQLRVGRSTLRGWIAADASRGRLTPVNENVHAWEVPAESQQTVRDQLTGSSLLVATRRCPGPLSGVPHQTKDSESPEGICLTLHLLIHGTTYRPIDALRTVSSICEGLAITRNAVVLRLGGLINPRFRVYRSLSKAIAAAMRLAEAPTCIDVLDADKAEDARWHRPVTPRFRAQIDLSGTFLLEFRRPGVVPAEQDLVPMAKAIFDSFPFRYGYVFNAKGIHAPLLYACGYVDERNETMTEDAKLMVMWGKALRKGRRGRVLRDLFTTNLLSQAYLDLPMGSVTFGEWICQSKTHGVLEPLVGRVYQWSVQKRYLPALRRELRAAGMLLDPQDYSGAIGSL